MIETAFWASLRSNEGRATRTFYWNPLQIADSEVFEDPVEAAAALRPRL